MQKNRKNIEAEVGLTLQDKNKIYGLIYNSNLQEKDKDYLFNVIDSFHDEILYLNSKIESVKEVVDTLTKKLS